VTHECRSNPRSVGPSVWYLCKYVEAPGPSSAGNRGYCLMSELAQLGSEVTIFCSDSGHHFFGGQGMAGEIPPAASASRRLRLIRIRTWKYRRQRSLHRIFSWLDFEFRLLTMSKATIEKPDVIIASSLSLLTVITGLLLKLRYRCKLIFEVRDIWPLTLVSEGGFSKANPVIVLLSWVERIGYRWSDLIVGTMPNLAEHVNKVVACSPPVHCIPIGFDGRYLPTEIGMAEAEPLVGELRGKLIVGYSGSFGISNALETLLDCAKSLERDERLHFVLMGDGDLRPTFQATYGNLKNVSFLRPVTRHQVARVLRGCDFLYFGTKRSEVWRYGQSLNKLIDYMLAGKPIICSYSGYLSMVNDAQCGIVVPSEDVGALRREILRAVDLGVDARRQMGERARQWVIANRSYATLGVQYRELVASLVADPVSETS
jgi:glycosyltransferase involved in cell wall biosynthesis